MARKTRSMSLKHLIDNSSKKVLFAEAKKDFIDFLFGLLQIPLGSIMGLLKENGIVASGSLSRICDSVTKLDPDYFLPNRNKGAVLRPEVAASSTPSLLQYFAPKKSNWDSERRSIFGAVSSSPLSSSPMSCASTPSFSEPLCFSSSTSSNDVGFVRGTVTYMVLDDLQVQPSSNISTVTLLNTFRVNNVASLEEKTVNIDLKKGLELVKASFESDTVLTDVFIGKVKLEDCK